MPRGGGPPGGNLKIQITRYAGARASVEAVTFGTAVLVAAALLVAATGAGLLMRRGNGRFRVTKPSRPVAIDPVLSSLGVTGGAVTLVQFSSAFCAPCRTTRVLCAAVAAQLAGVRHVEVDAESHLDAVRALDVWRTPTVLIVDAGGTVRRRATGAPSRAQLLAAIAEVLPQTEVGTSPTTR